MFKSILLDLDPVQDWTSNIRPYSRDDLFLLSQWQPTIREWWKFRAVEVIFWCSRTHATLLKKTRPESPGNKRPVETQTHGFYTPFSHRDLNTPSSGTTEKIWCTPPTVFINHLQHRVTLATQRCCAASVRKSLIVVLLWSIAFIFIFQNALTVIWAWVEMNSNFAHFVQFPSIVEAKVIPTCQTCHFLRWRSVQKTILDHILMQITRCWVNWTKLRKCGIPAPIVQSHPE